MNNQRPRSNKLATFITLFLLGGLIVLIATIRPKPEPKPAASANTEALTKEDVVRIPHGRVLYVVVDFDGVYLGQDRLDPLLAKDAINAMLKAEKIHNLVIYGTTEARFGPAADIFAHLDPSLVRWKQFGLLPLKVGDRKPLTGFLKRMCCGYYDSENETEP